MRLQIQENRSCLILNPSQIIRRLTFLTPSLTTRLIQNFVQKISLLLSWLGLLIKVLQEWLKFDYVCIIFLTKTSGQTWGQKSQTSYNLGWRSIWYLTPCLLGQKFKPTGPVRFAEKPWLKILFADLLWEKNTVRSLKQYGS